MLQNSSFKFLQGDESGYLMCWQILQHTGRFVQQFFGHKLQMISHFPEADIIN